MLLALKNSINFTSPDKNIFFFAKLVDIPWYKIGFPQNPNNTYHNYDFRVMLC